MDVIKLSKVEFNKLLDHPTVKRTFQYYMAEEFSKGVDDEPIRRLEFSGVVFQSEGV